MDSDNPELQAAALALAQNQPGSLATVQWLNKLRQVSPQRQSQILAMLGRRGDRIATPAVRESLESSDKDVRLAALKTAVQLDGTAAVLDLSLIHI